MFDNVQIRSLTSDLKSLIPSLSTCASVMSLLDRSVFVLLYVSRLHLSVPSHVCTHMCVSLCVCSVSARGSICVRLTRREPLSAGSPGGPKSSGRPEAWNPSRPGQMSLCSARLGLRRPHRPLKDVWISERRPDCLTLFKKKKEKEPPPNWIEEPLFELNMTSRCAY